mgnify:CR=1 FL=1
MAHGALWYSRKRRRWIYGSLAPHELSRLAKSDEPGVSAALCARATVAWYFLRRTKPAEIAKQVGWGLGRVYRFQAAMKAARDALSVVMGYTGGRRRKYTEKQLREGERLLRERRRSYSPENLEARRPRSREDYAQPQGRIAPTIAEIENKTGVGRETIKKVRAARRLPLPKRSYRRRFRAQLRGFEADLRLELSSD